ncbi:patatin-like phospholipase family protein [Vibrio quintilis]|uniref:Putative sporulation hydrolase CotR n=1 Tax=Vibrio quintilis TaxID=1117707 RepID=A0A1M7YSX8_9VIBR|nr:patatin-like phospholipase family protein [Vibrio quintilis]SHO55722.1 Putative sporulation hydrolase CotR [Vibrio quintilis]
MSKTILSVDGGGIRGAAVTQFLSRLEKQLQDKHGISLRDCVDFYAGTSTGSVITLALATSEMDITELNKLYTADNVKPIFSDNSRVSQVPGLYAPKYSGDSKTLAMQASFGDIKLSAVPDGKHVLAVAFDVTNRRPRMICSTREADRELLASAVADASGAAPTLYPSVELGEDWMIDGCVIADNPTMYAIAEARKEWRGTALDDFKVISIGTGCCTRKITGIESRKWGAAEWFTQGNFLDIVTNGMAVSYQAMNILKPGSYIRVNAEMRQQPGLPNPPDDAMDDCSAGNISKLKKMGDWWFELYGESVIQLLRDEYAGPSLDRVDSLTGKPIENILE